MFFIGLEPWPGQVTDLWPIVVSQVAALVTVTGFAAATRQLGLPQAGARGLAMLTGSIGADGNHRRSSSPRTGGCWPSRR